MAADELDEHYRKRSLLKRSVLPEDVAEAVYFLASDASAKSTGNILNVDAGNAQAFTRASMIDPALIETENAARATLERDYAALGERLPGAASPSTQVHRPGRRLNRGPALLGRRHRRHPLCPLSRPRRAARHLRQARRLRRDP